MIIFYCRERSRGSKHDVEIKRKSHIAILLNTSQVKVRLCVVCTMKRTTHCELCGHCFCFFSFWSHFFVCLVEILYRLCRRPLTGLQQDCTSAD